ncbi:MAG: hypothetical protein ACM3JI_02855, partial [Anaerolineae bacterium]
MRYWIRLACCLLFSMSFGFLSSESFKIFDEIAYFCPKEIGEDSIFKDKSGQDREKILDSERIKPKTQVAKEREDDGLALSTPEQIATLTADADFLIEGLISPMSGQLCLRKTDLIAKGAQSLFMSRTYIPPYMPCSFAPSKKQDRYHLFFHLMRTYQGWIYLPHLRLQVTPNLGTLEVRLALPSGMSVDFLLGGPHHSEVGLLTPPYGFSNTVQGIPSGKDEVRNTRFTVFDNGHFFVVHASDGTRRHYRASFKNPRAKSYLCLLEKEILPHGKVIKYIYDPPGVLSSIESLDSKERYVYASIRLERSAFEDRLVTSSDESATYFYQTRQIEGHDAKHSHLKGDSPQFLAVVSSPFYRHEKLEYDERLLLSHYNGKDEAFRIVHGAFGQHPHYRIQNLFLPTGPHNAFCIADELTYDPPIPGEREGVTRVKQNDGTSLVYHLSKNLLVMAIQWFDPAGQLKREKRYQWHDFGWLLSLECFDGARQMLYRKEYRYDNFGNPTVEIFSGNLSGNGGYESHEIKREFSQDGRHLLLKEEIENGPTTCYQYLAQTNLVTVKLTKEKDRILIREFYEYDDCHNLIKKMRDDGNSEEPSDIATVTERLITNYRLRQQAPFLHMVEWIEETYLVNGQEKLLKKMHLLYDKRGNVSEEEVYDATG